MPSLNVAAKQLGVSRNFLRAITGAHGPTSNPHFPDQTVRQLAEQIRRDSQQFMADRQHREALRDAELDEMSHLI